MPTMRGAIGGRAGQPGAPVILKHVDAVGVRLAISLLRAGYRVLGVDVAARCREDFEAAGGLVLAGDAPESIAWVIECREQSNLRPDVLSRIAAGSAAFGRPRLEITSALRTEGTDREHSIASLVVVPFDGSEATLSVNLGVTARGPELIVRGERPLFEKALPLLTALSDRVLYSASSRDCPA